MSIKNVVKFKDNQSSDMNSKHPEGNITEKSTVNESHVNLDSSEKATSFNSNVELEEIVYQDVKEYDNDTIVDIANYDKKQNDSLLEKDYLSSLIEQEDRLVYYEVENIYSNHKNKRFRNKMNLKKDPPILIIKDDYDNEANFLLTENLTDELLNTLSEVKRAYYGFSGPKDLNQPSNFKDKMFFYFKNQPLKLLLPVTIVAFLLFFILNK